MTEQTKDQIAAINQILLAGEPENVSYDTYSKHSGYKPQFIIDAMNTAIGLGNWGFDELLMEDNTTEKEKATLFIAKVKVWLKGVDFQPTGYGQARITKGDEGDAKKGAQTDAIKKALSYFSIGNRAYQGLIPLKDEDEKPAEARSTHRSIQPQRAVASSSLSTTATQGTASARPMAALTAPPPQQQQQETRAIQAAPPIVQTAGVGANTQATVKIVPRPITRIGNELAAWKQKVGESLSPYYEQFGKYAYFAVKHSLGFQDSTDTWTDAQLKQMVFTCEKWANDGTLSAWGQEQILPEQLQEITSFFKTTSYGKSAVEALHTRLPELAGKPRQDFTRTEADEFLALLKGFQVTYDLALVYDPGFKHLKERYSPLEHPLELCHAVPERLISQGNLDVYNDYLLEQFALRPSVDLKKRHKQALQELEDLRKLQQQQQSA